MDFEQAEDCPIEDCSLDQDTLSSCLLRTVLFPIAKKQCNSTFRIILYLCTFCDGDYVLCYNKVVTFNEVQF